MDKVERPRLARWVTWLIMTVLIVLIASATLTTGRFDVFVGALAGLSGAWLLTALVRNSQLRRWWVVGTGVTVGLLGIAAGVIVSTRVTQSSPPTPRADAVTIPYTAVAQLDGTSVLLREEIVLDDLVNRAIDAKFGPLTASEDIDQMREPEGWTWLNPPTGPNGFVRTRTIAPSRLTLISTEYTISIDLSDLPVRGSTVPLAIRDPSVLVARAPTGALIVSGSISMRDAVDIVDGPPPDAPDAISVQLNRNSTEVTVTVLAEPVRGPAGHALYRAVHWRWLPWLCAALIVVFGSVLWDRLLRLFGPPTIRPVSAGLAPPELEVGSEPLVPTEPLVHDVLPDQTVLPVVERPDNRGEDRGPR